MMQKLTLTALALIMTAAPALAREAAPLRGGGAALPQAEFGAIDTDGDGHITLEEWTAYLQHRRAAMRAQAVSARVDALFDAAGAGPDDALTRDDLAEAMAVLRAQAAERRGERGRDRRSHGWGRGQDQAAGHGRMGWPRGRAASVESWAERSFARIDSDDDGVISPEELAAAQGRWQEHAERRAERRSERRADPDAAGRGNRRSRGAE